MVDTIFHIADLHLRNGSRHKEYLQVIDKTIREISTRKTNNSIIVLAGDLVHAKTDMSPELVQYLSYFLKEFADICPTIIITGNHDCNLNNPTRLDALTPIVNSLAHPNLIYWKDTGVYQIELEGYPTPGYDNIKFSVMSVYDTPDKYITADKIQVKKGQYKIALFHGPVHNAQTEIGYTVSRNDMTIDKFKGFDFVLLGDIHKPAQFLDLHKTIAYPGSLIQQNHGEDLNHGFLEWDLKHKTVEFIPVQNDYGYVTLDIIGGEFNQKNWKGNLPKKARVRVRYDSTTTPSQLKLALTEIRTTCDVIEYTPQKLKDNFTENFGNDKLTYENIYDISYQDQLIGEYLSVIGLNDDSIFNDIKKINADLNQKLRTRDVQKNLIWKPIRLEFSNMFSYGEGNIIDFTDMLGMQGIFANNASGKSSLVDVLIFCLFDKSSRTSRGPDIINNKSDKFNCKLKFQIDDSIFEIERIGIKSKHGNVRVDVNFTQYTSDGQTISLNGDDRDQTNKIIRTYIGTYDNFILTAASLQADGEEFISMKQRHRKELLSKYLNLDIFDSLEYLANDEVKETAANIRTLKKQSFDVQLAKSTNLLNQYSGSLNVYRGQLVQFQAREDQLSKDLYLASSQLKDIDEALDGTKLLNQLHSTDLELTGSSNTRKIQNTRRAELLDQHKLKLGEFEKYRLSGYGKFDQLTVLESKKTEINSDIIKLTSQLDHDVKSTKKLEKHEYDPNCQYCVKNPFVIEAKTAEDRIPILKEKISDLEVDLVGLNFEISEIVVKRDAFIKCESDLKKIDLDIKLLDSEISVTDQKLLSLQSQRDNILDKLKRYEKQKEYIQENIRVKQRMIELKLELDSVKSNINILTKDIENTVGVIKVQEKHKDDAINGLLELEKLHQIWIAYDWYLKAVKRDGLPYYLIQKLLPQLESEINNILSHMVGFSIKLETDPEDKNINAHIVYSEKDTWPVELISGMEKFITSLAIRVSLLNVSSLPRPNFMVIDEGFGVLDADNLNSLYLLFEYLRTQFDYIICISHLASMRDMADDLIEISKINGFSKVYHTNN